MTNFSLLDTPRRRYVTWKDGFCAGMLFLLLVSTHWFMINISASVPLGLYRLVRDAPQARRDDLVRIPAVSFGRPWPYTWLPLLKPVAGVPGDEVCILPSGVWVEDEAYGPVYTESQGKLLPVFWGCHVVGPWEVFVASHEEKSLDGRYFGMTPVADVRRVVPLWTWK